MLSNNDTSLNGNNGEINLDSGTNGGFDLGNGGFDIGNGDFELGGTTDKENGGLNIGGGINNENGGGDYEFGGWGDHGGIINPGIGDFDINTSNSFWKNNPIFGVMISDSVTEAGLKQQVIDSQEIIEKITSGTFFENPDSVRSNRIQADIDLYEKMPCYRPPEYSIARRIYWNRYHIDNAHPETVYNRDGTLINAGDDDNAYDEPAPDAPMFGH